MSDENGSGRYESRRKRAKRPASLEFPDDLYMTIRVLAKHTERSIAATVRAAVREMAERTLPSPKEVAKIMAEIEAEDLEKAAKKAAKVAAELSA